MINIYTRLIELGIVIIVGVTIWLINEIKSSIQYRKSQKEWIDSSFEHNGARYSKKYFQISADGTLTHNL